jgi:hypothetical protein
MSSEEDRLARQVKMARDYEDRYQARQVPDFGSRKRRVEEAKRAIHQQRSNRKAG